MTDAERIKEIEEGLKFDRTGTNDDIRWLLERLREAQGFVQGLEIALDNEQRLQIKTAEQLVASKAREQKLREMVCDAIAIIEGKPPYNPFLFPDKAKEALQPADSKGKAS